MQRRVAVQALVLAGGTAAWRGAAAAVEWPTFAWGPAGVWLAHASGLVQVLAARLPPAPVAGGLWVVSLDGALQRWRPGGGTGWAVAAQATVPEPPHALAASADGRQALVAHGERLSMFDADGALLRAFDGRDLAGHRRGPARALFALAGRSSFVATWPALGELWEISLDPAAAPIFDGLVHDYRMGEAIARPGHLGARRTPLELPLPIFDFADPRLPWVAGIDTAGMAIVHLDVRRRIATLPLAGARPGAGVLRRDGDSWQWWVPGDAGLHVVDCRRWTELARHRAPGPVRALAVLDGRIGLLAGTPVVLWTWQDGHWRRLAGTWDSASALGADERTGQWLVATTEPAAVHRLDADGRTQARWVLPRGVQVDGVAAVA